MSPLDDFDQTDILVVSGTRSQASRRLSDKILAAFSHAYAVGETEVATRLRDALAASEARHGWPGENRRGYDPLGQAETWVAFIEARNAYRVLAENTGADPDAVAVALDTMKEAYRLWSAD